MGCGGRVTRRGTITRGKANRVESAVLGNHFDLTITNFKKLFEKIIKDTGSCVILFSLCIWSDSES